MCFQQCFGYFSAFFIPQNSMNFGASKITDFWPPSKSMISGLKQSFSGFIWFFIHLSVFNIFLMCFQTDRVVGFPKNTTNSVFKNSALQKLRKTNSYAKSLIACNLKIPYVKTQKILSFDSYKNFGRHVSIKSLKKSAVPFQHPVTKW